MSFVYSKSELKQNKEWKIQIYIHPIFMNCQTFAARSEDGFGSICSIVSKCLTVPENGMNTYRFNLMDKWSIIFWTLDTAIFFKINNNLRLCAHIFFSNQFHVLLHRTSNQNIPCEIFFLPGVSILL